MTRARKSAIMKGRVMPEQSEVVDALHAIADGLFTVAGSVAYLAAAEHTDTAGEQRQLAAVITQTAKLRFGGIKYDGQRITEAEVDQLDKMLCKITGRKK